MTASESGVPGTTEQVAADAAEFGLHVRQGGWRLGLLVARSVDPNGKGGRPRKTPEGSEVPGKVSMAKFARGAGIDDHTVRRHLDAWEVAAGVGIVPAAANLVPGQEIDLSRSLKGGELPDWSGWYRASESPDFDPEQVTGGNPEPPDVEGFWASVEDPQVLLLRDLWHQLNAKHFESRLTLPIIELLDLGKCKHGDSRPGRIRINSREPGSEYYVASTRQIGDTLLHEMIHQFVDERVVGQFASHGHPFVDKANEIGATLGLAAIARNGASNWPSTVRPAGYYPKFHCGTCSCDSSGR
jgi:hypothetical protein